MNDHSAIERIWRRPNDLALDAAGVAMLWYAAIAQQQGLTVAPAPLAVLGMSVWLVYIGDRWLDVRGQSSEALPTQRHRQVSHYHRAFLGMWIVVLLGNVTLAIIALPKAQLMAGIVVLAASIAYTVGIQVRSALQRTKELQIGLIFAAGVGIFLVGEPIESLIWLLATLAFFGLICFINCALLARWEVQADRQLGRPSLALALGSRAHVLPQLALLLGAVGVLLGTTHPVIRNLGFYACLLWLMDRSAWPIEPEDRRCVADGMLAVFGALSLLV